MGFARSYHHVRDDSKVLPEAASVSYLPNHVAAAYNFPAANSSPQGIALIELGGGYRQPDVDAAFKAMSLPTPHVEFVSIQGATNAPDGPNGAEGEVQLDIQVAGGVTGGKIPIYVVMAPNTDTGFAAAIMWAAKDPRVTVVSISWGGPEDQWTPSSIAAMEAALSACAAANKPVFVAAGDNGSGDGEAGNHVDYPASSPHVIGCGGTNLQPNGNETVWNDGPGGGATGGGLSARFSRLPVQTSVPGSGRGVPDVAGVASVNTGWEIVIQGRRNVIGGTSAVAPMWAGLAAVLAQHIGAMPSKLLQHLYSMQSAFKDITVGNNGTFIARSGYDCCTGLGSPNGTKLLAMLSGSPTPPTPPTPPAPPPAPSVPSVSISTVITAIDAELARLEQLHPGQRAILQNLGLDLDQMLRSKFG